MSIKPLCVSATADKRNGDGCNLLRDCLPCSASLMTGVEWIKGREGVTNLGNGLKEES